MPYFDDDLIRVLLYRDTFGYLKSGGGFIFLDL